MNRKTIFNFAFHHIYYFLWGGLSGAYNGNVTVGCKFIFAALEELCLYMWERSALYLEGGLRPMSAARNGTVLRGGHIGFLLELPTKTGSIQVTNLHAYFIYGHFCITQ